MLEAIVLARRNFREYDEIVSLFSKERGKVEVLARGSKKIMSKNAPFLEMASHIQAGVVPGKEIEHLTTVQSISYFSSLRKNVLSAQGVFSVLFWLEKTLSPHQKDEALFHLLLSWLHFVNENKMTLGILDAFFFKAASSLGFEPHLSGCAQCGISLVSDTQVFFSFESGGILCKNHALVIPKPIGQNISSSLLLSLEYFLVRSWREIGAYEIDSQKEKVHDFIYKYLLYTLEKEIGDWNFEKIYEKSRLGA